MVFSSLTFLYFFLPVVLFFYYISPKHLRNTVLLLSNLLFYGWGEPRYLWVMAVVTLLNYACALGVMRYREKKQFSRLFLWSSVAGSLGVLAYFKYFAFFLETAQKTGLLHSVGVPRILLPIGISFYTFQAMSYTIDVYRGDTRAQKNPLLFGAYLSLFPQLIAGPIVRYRDVEEQLVSRKESVPLFADGVRLFTIGLMKKVILANEMGLLWDALRSTPQKPGVLGAWVGLFAYAFQIYFDFSGYSDMARGLGKLFGFEFMENFNYPYISKSITEFWRRWHISLSSWFRDYVYIPLGGSRKGKARTVLNLLVVWALTGFWHGANVNFLLWGLYYFVFLMLEKLFLGKILEKLPKVARHLYTIVVVLFGWALFFFESPSALFSYLGNLFDLSGGLLGTDAGALILAYLPLLLLAAVASTPFGKRLWKKLDRPLAIRWLQPVLLLLGIVLCTASLVSGGYNPFLYFRF